MYWVRSNRRFGSWAALFALAIQLVLSFGHIHIEDTQSPLPLWRRSLRRNPMPLPTTMTTAVSARIISAQFARRSA